MKKFKYDSMLKTNPFITISIPSLNRIESLKLVINSILIQTFSDYEILIIDDHSDDDIGSFIKSLKSKKIRLINNKKRVGFKSVYSMALLKARGEYVITLGNDDILCDKNSLKNISIKLKNKKVGLAKVGLIYYYKSIDKPCFSTSLEEKNIYIPGKNHNEIFRAVDRYGLTHIAGNIYLRELITKKSFLDNELTPFLSTIIECAVAKGFMFIVNEYIAVGVSTSYLSIFSQKSSYKKFWFFVMYELSKKYLGEQYAKKDVKQKMIVQIPNFIAIKQYVGISELVHLVQAYIIFDKLFLFNVKLYVSLLASFIVPRFLFLRIRDWRYEKMIGKFHPPEKYWHVHKIIQLS